MLAVQSNLVFAAGFTAFVIAFVVLIVLVVRFTLQRGALARRNWLAERQDRGGAGRKPSS